MAKGKGVSFTSSQTGSSSAEVPLAYTANPFGLLLSDLRLTIAKLPLAAVIFWPLPSHPTDELYPTWRNMFDLAVHIFLVIYQTIYLLAIPTLLILGTPASLFFLILGLGLLFNQVISKLLLNGPRDTLHSRVELSASKPHPSEQWIFCNGVAVGHHWLQANLDRLALTFRRPVRGVLNQTNGALFDLIQCLIERNFAYATNDVRAAYRGIKEALLDPDKTKIVLILHSQGGIQGSLVVDWLLDEFPHSTLNKLEIFTFGNAANHFNNPSDAAESGMRKAISYIEHYGNTWDFVAQWGVFHYTSIRNRYMGRIFRAPASGHLMNQHYLDSMFSLDPDTAEVAEKNDFMDAVVDVHSSHEDEENEEDGEKSHNPYHDTATNGDSSTIADGKANGKLTDRRESRETLEESCCLAQSADPLNALVDGVFDGIDAFPPREAAVEDINSPVQRVAKRASGTLRVKDFSRLWQYRNGRSPPAPVFAGGK